MAGSWGHLNEASYKASSCFHRRLPRVKQACLCRREQVGRTARRRSPSEFDKLSLIHNAGRWDRNLARALREMYVKDHLNAAYREAQEVPWGYEETEV